MTIAAVYKKFGVPPNLQEHMLRVWAVVDFLEKHWKGGTRVDWVVVKQASLLHDLGNMVKFDFDKHPEFLGDEAKNIDFWRRVKNEVVAKYGNDDHEATRQMLQEISIEPETIAIILSKSFGNSVKIAESNDWSLKILYYADLLTLPFGIGTLEERIADVRNRMEKYTQRLDFEDLVSACRQIEAEIQENLDVPVSEITNDTIKINRKALERMEA